MLPNYLKLALRNFRRQPFFTAVNVLGLSVGLAACWLIGLFVLNEYTYDRYLPNANRICAVALDLKMGQEEGRTTNTPPPLGQRLASDFPEVEAMARTFYLQTTTVRREEAGSPVVTFNENTVYAADTSFLELFDFQMVEGDVHSALDQPGSLVLSQWAANKYFGDSAPMGRQLVFNNRAFTVTGVVRDLPANSTVQFDFLLPMVDFKVVQRFDWSWIWLQVDTWVRLREVPTAASLAALEAQFPTMVRTHAPAAFERVGQNFAEQLQRGDRYDVKLLPLPTLHLGQTNLTSSRLTTLGDGSQVRMYGLVGGLILLLACVNFMNLSTARSMRRAREVGVRKALGSQRGTLIGQFLLESLLYSTAALVLAGVLAGLALPLFNQLTNLELQLADLFSPKTLALGAGLSVVAGLLGGSYPAFYLSYFQPLAVLKTASGTSKGGHARVRSGLVVFQFAVSVALMLSAWVVYRQLDFARTQSPGLQREHVLVLPLMRHLEGNSKVEALRQQVLQLPEVVAASHSTFLPSLGSFGDFYEPEQGNQRNPVVTNLPLSGFLTDADFGATLGLEIVQGRDFLPSNSKVDSTSVILNEAAVKAIGWSHPIGQWLRYPGNANQRFQVVGVMRDFHLGSVRAAIEPAALFHESSKSFFTWASYLTVRLRPGTEKAAVAKIGTLWAATAPNAPYDYDFLDATFARLYRSEQQSATILGVFTGLALFIGCLGLLALATFTAEQRTKEIGVRKVLGASVGSITGLLTRDFLQLVLVAVVIASPVAYYLMNRWLADFVYRVEVTWWMFAGVGGAALLIAFLTVSFQSVRAALADPVRSLRNE